MLCLYVEIFDSFSVCKYLKLWFFSECGISDPEECHLITKGEKFSSSARTAFLSLMLNLCDLKRISLLEVE